MHMLGIPEVVAAYPGIDQLGVECRIASDVSVMRLARYCAQQGIVLGNRVSLYDSVRLVLGDPEQHPDTNLIIGDDVIVNVFSYLSGEGGLHIANEVLIGSHVRLLSAGHSIDHGLANVWHNPLTYARITIEQGAWISAGVTVLQGITIGQGAVVGAGSVVTRDVPAFAVVAGNPARLIRYRKGFEPRRSWWRLKR